MAGAEEDPRQVGLQPNKTRGGQRGEGRQTSGQAQVGRMAYCTQRIYVLGIEVSTCIGTERRFLELGPGSDKPPPASHRAYAVGGATPVGGDAAASAAPSRARPPATQVGSLPSPAASPLMGGLLRSIRIEGGELVKLPAGPCYTPIACAAAAAAAAPSQARRRRRPQGCRRPRRRR